MEYVNKLENLSVSEIVVYLRKSRSDNPAESVEDVLFKHEGILQDFAVRTWGEKIPEKNIYREVVSGETIEARPIVKAVLSLIELPKYKAVLTIEPQRLTRGDLSECGQIINTFRYTNTIIITPSITYDLEDKRDRKFFESELMRGNDYLEYIKEIMGRGRLAAVMRGCYIANIAPYGFSKCVINKNHTLERKDPQANAVLMMFEWKVYDRVGPIIIGRRLDSLGVPAPNGAERWSPYTIASILKNPVYDGKIRYGYRPAKKVMVDGQLTTIRPRAKEMEYIIVEGLHDALVPHDLFVAAQEDNGRIPRKKALATCRNPFAGLLVCPCGRKMSLRTYMKNGVERSAPRLLCDNQHNCHTRSVLYSEMVEAVSVTLESHINIFKLELENSPDPSLNLHESKVKQLESEIARLEEKGDKQRDFLEDGLYTKDEYIKRNTKLQERIKSLTAELEKTKKEMPVVIDYKDKIFTFSQAIKMINDRNVDAGEVNKFLKSIIDRIEYRNETDAKRHSGEKLIGGWKDNSFSIDIFLKF